MLKLHLLRHAKTEQQSPTGKDFDRELMLKGIIQTNMISVYFQEHDIYPKLILCSSSKRTTQTLHILRESMRDSDLKMDDNLYLADRESLLQMIWDQKKGAEILIIGHNEGLSELASYLFGETIHLKTCGYLSLSFPFDKWKEISFGTGTILASYRPSVQFP